MRRLLLACIGILAGLLTPAARAEGVLGYYREPALHGSTLVFVAEGDLWVVPLEGGTARRLTSHPGEEASPAISPDGRTVAFTAEYEGPREVYTMRYRQLFTAPGDAWHDAVHVPVAPFQDHVMVSRITTSALPLTCLIAALAGAEPT